MGRRHSLIVRGQVRGGLPWLCAHLKMTGPGSNNVVRVIASAGGASQNIDRALSVMAALQGTDFRSVIHFKFSVSPLVANNLSDQDWMDLYRHHLKLMKLEKHVSLALLHVKDLSEPVALPLDMTAKAEPDKLLVGDIPVEMTLDGVDELEAPLERERASSSPSGEGGGLDGEENVGERTHMHVIVSRRDLINGRQFDDGNLFERNRLAQVALANGLVGQKHGLEGCRRGYNIYGEPIAKSRQTELGRSRTRKAPLGAIAEAEVLALVDAAMNQAATAPRGQSLPLFVERLAVTGFALARGRLAVGIVHKSDPGLFRPLAQMMGRPAGDLARLGLEYPLMEWESGRGKRMQKTAEQVREAAAWQAIVAKERFAAVEKAGLAIAGPKAGGAPLPEAGGLPDWMADLPFWADRSSPAAEPNGGAPDGGLVVPVVAPETDAVKPL